jgi:hypothetical protein
MLVGSCLKCCVFVRFRILISGNALETRYVTLTGITPAKLASTQARACVVLHTKGASSWGLFLMEN